MTGRKHALWNQPPSELWLGSLLAEILPRVGALEGAIQIADDAMGGDLEGGAPVSVRRWAPAARRRDTAHRSRAPGGTAPGSSWHRVALPYQGSTIGSLWLKLAAIPQLPHEISAAAQSVAYQIQRLRIRRQLADQLPGELPLLGNSAALKPVDRFIEQAGRVDLSVWIQGEAGTEKSYVAFAIHAVSSRRSRPFVDLECGALASGQTSLAELSERLRSAAGGTIFLRDVDQLPSSLHQPLIGLLTGTAGAGNGTRKRSETPPDGAPRLVVSSTEDLHRLACEDRFPRPLVETLCCLALCLPPLRKRKEDIEPLLQSLAARPALRGPRRLSHELTAYFLRYPWPGNLSEMSRIVARLTLLSDHRTLGLSDLRTLAPELLGHADGSQPEPGASSDALPPAGPIGNPWSLAGHLLAGDFAPLSHLHPGVLKAVQYLAHHYQKKIRLETVARHACLAPSYLSVLFHRSLGYTFRDLLCVLRLQKARQLLASEPQRSITDICFEVGFSELSTFERCFKQWVGCRPREYRGAGRRNSLI